MAEALKLNMEQLLEIIAGQVKSAVASLGLTQVDRKYAIHPAEDEMTGRMALTPERKLCVANFLRGVLIPDARYSEMKDEHGNPYGAYWRDLLTTTPSEGGYLVPTEFRAQVIMTMEKLPVLRNLVSVFPISGKDEIPAVSAKPAASWGSENVDWGSSDAAFGNITLASNLLKVLSKMSRKLAANSRVDIVVLLSQLFAVAFGKAEDLAFVTGNGTGKPKGIRAETVTTASQAGANLAGDDLIELYHALPEQYRINATWLVHDSVVKKIRKLKEATTGNYLWVPGLAGAPSTILGRPVAVQNDIPTNLGSASPAVESEIWFGDFKFYYVGDDETMGIEATTVGGAAFGSHQLHIKAWEELDGKMALNEAFAKLDGVK